MNEVFLISWLESERGWGTRLDGCSIHLSLEDASFFVKDYNKTLPDAVAEEYSRPDGSPKKVNVSLEIYNKILDSKNGVRIWQQDMREEVSNEKIVII